MLARVILAGSIAVGLLLQHLQVVVEVGRDLLLLLEELLGRVALAVGASRGESLHATPLSRLCTPRPSAPALLQRHMTPLHMSVLAVVPTCLAVSSLRDTANLISYSLKRCHRSPDPHVELLKVVPTTSLSTARAALPLPGGTTKKK